MLKKQRISGTLKSEQCVDSEEAVTIVFGSATTHNLNQSLISHTCDIYSLDQSAESQANLLNSLIKTEERQSAEEIWTELFQKIGGEQDGKK